VRPTVDHATLATRDLAATADALAAAGIETVAGGTHADGTTRMRLATFPDGSYLELIATTRGTDPADAGYWPDLLAADAGPCAWAVRADGDAADAAVRAVRAGFPVDGPHPGGRRRPDGTRLSWDAVTVGDRWRGLLPFVVADRTPRARRVPPAARPDAPLTGIEAVVVAVADLDDAADALARRDRAPAPEPFDSGALGPAVDLAAVPGHPVVLATPTADGPLAERIERFGPRPRAVVLGTDDPAGARAACALDESHDWPGGGLSWLDAGEPGPDRTVGVLGADAGAET
jgi:hypothetical protein